jgi:hypothetical protein
MNARKGQVPSDSINRRQFLLLTSCAIVGMALAGATSDYLFDGSASPPTASPTINQRAALPLEQPNKQRELDDSSRADFSAAQPEGKVTTPNLPPDLAALLANIREIAALPDSPERETKLQALINSLPEWDVSAFVIFLGKTLPFGTQDTVLNRLVSRWADIDVLAAA